MVGPRKHDRPHLALLSLSFFILFFLSPRISANLTNDGSIERLAELDAAVTSAQDEGLFLGNDVLDIQFYSKSPSSQLRFNETTYGPGSFYTNVIWTQLSEGQRQWPIPTDFVFNKTSVPNSYGNGTLLQRVSFNATVNKGLLLADVYLTNEAVNMTLTSSFDSTEPSFTSYAPLNLPSPTKVPSRFLYSTPENNSITIQLGPNALLVKLRVFNWQYNSTKDKLAISGNVKSSASGIDVSFSKYPPPTNNLAQVALPGGPKVIVVHLLNNATMGCDGRIKSVYVDTRYDIISILSPVSANIQLVFPPLSESFLCLNASNQSVPCACNETFVDYLVYMELDKFETIVRWWLIAGIIVLAVGGFMVLIFILLCVARWYNRVLKEDKLQEKEARRERKSRKGKKKALLAADPETPGGGAAAVLPLGGGEEPEVPKKQKRMWRRKDEVGSAEETDPLLRFVYKKKTI